MNLLKAWNAIAARAYNRPDELTRKRRSFRRPMIEQLEDRRLMAIVGIEQPSEGGHNDGDELQPDPGDDVPSGTPQCFPCQTVAVNNAPRMTGGAADSADVSASGAVLDGSGATQLRGPAMSVSNVAEIFGQSLLYSNDWFSQSGAGASLYIPGAFATGDVLPAGGSVNTLGSSMFGNGWSSAYMPQLFEVAGGTSDWNFTPFIDHFYAPDGPPAAHATDGNGHEWYWQGDGTDQGGSKIILVNGSLTEIFDKAADNTYTAEFYTPDKLSFTDGQYTLVDAAGTSFRFHNFNFNPADYLPGATTPDYQRQMGQLFSITDAGGNAATMTYDSSSRLTEVDVNAGSTLANVYKFSYDSPVASNLCTNVALFRGASIDTAPVQQAVYEYYDAHTDTGPGANGNKGDLMLAQIEDGANWNSSDPSTKGEGNVVDTEYFRYEAYQPGMLHYMFSNASFNRLSGAVTDPMSASDSQVSPYADVHLEFETIYGVRVTTLDLQGAGCSICGGGLGSYGYQYDYSTTQPSDHEFNMYTVKTTETLPDGSFNVVYSNWCGETLLSDHFVTDAGPHWISYYRYDSSGRILEIANPSGVIGYTPVTDSGRDTGDLGVTLNSTGGEFQLFDYYGTTTSTLDVTGTTSPTSTSSTTPGGYQGYIEDTKLVHGDPASTTSANVPILESYTRYIAVTAGLVSVAEVADTSIYSTADSCPTATDPGTITGGKQTTSYAYTFYPGMVWAKYETTTLPDVSGTSDEGIGVGASDQIASAFDSLGHEVWQRDARGFISYANYDPATGALLESIQDVNTSWSGLTSLPNASLLPTGTGGWTTPTGGGLNLIAVDVIDNLGRPVIQIDPINDVTFTEYLDTLHEVRTYTGWKYTAGTGGYANLANYSQDTSSTRPPVAVAFDDLAYTTTIDDITVGESYSESLTMTQIARSTTTGSSTVITLNGVELPIGAEPIANVQSLSLDIQNQGGQSVETRDFYVIPSLTSFISGSSGSDSVLAAIGAGTPWDYTSPTTAANFYAVTYAYGDTGQLDRVKNADGVIRRAVYDSLGRVTSTWIGAGTADGTTDAEIDAWSPSNPGGMIELTANVYDNGGMGDSNLTEMIAFPNGNGDDAGNFRVTLNSFDWRGRLVNSKSGALVEEVAPDTTGAVHIDGLSELSTSPKWLLDDPSDEGASGDTTKRPLVHLQYDNLDQIIEQDVFAGNGVLQANVTDSGVSTASSGDTLLRSKASYSTDSRGRVYGTSEYAVDQGSGAAGSSPRVNSVQYDPADNVVFSTDARSSVTTFSYDGAGRLKSRRDPSPTDGTSGSGPLTQLTYDAASRLISTTDPLSNVYGSVFDAAGRLIRSIAPNPSTGSTTSGLTTNYAYDANTGLLATKTDPMSNVTTYTDDALGRRLKVDLPDPASGNHNSSSPAVTLTYDGDGNIVSEVDPRGYETDYSYTLLDQVATESQTVALSYTGTVSSPTITTTTATSHFYYNNLGDLKKQVNPGTAGTDDRTITYDYNVLGQRTAENWFASSTSSTVTNTINYQYSVLDGLALAAASYGSSDSRNSKLTFTTDAFGDVTSVDNHGGESGGTAGVPRVVLNATFDANSNRTALNAAIGSGTGTADFQNTMAFDYLNRQTSIVQQSASGGNAVAYKKTTFGYNAGSQTTSIADYTTSTAELMHASLAYDRAERLTSIQWHDDAHTGSGYGGFGSTGYWEQLTYGNDNNSRVTGITSAEYSGENASYTYDHTGQLTQDDLGYGGYGGYGGALRHLFSWDANGNPTGSSVGTSTGYGGFSYVTDSGYLLGAGNRLLSDGNYKYVYDPSGNLITRYGIATGTIAQSDYTWDNRNRLVEVQNRGTVGGSITLDITYVYDMFDRLISRTQGSTTTLFAYDGKRMVLAFTSSGGITDRFVWGPAVDQILADEHYTTPSTTSAGTTKWAVFDKQNSIRDLVLSSDSLANHVVYDSFGAVTSGGDPILFLHEGVFTDPSTGMEWHSDPASGFPGRWYDPASKRWLSEDPTGLIPDSNPYRDVHNSPTNWIDPTGLQHSPPTKDEITNGRAVPIGDADGDGITDYKFPDALKGSGFTLYSYSTNGWDFYVISDTTGDIVHRCPYEGGENDWKPSNNGHTYRGGVTNPSTHEKITYYYDAGTHKLKITVFNDKGVAIRRQSMTPPKKPDDLPWPWQVTPINPVNPPH